MKILASKENKRYWKTVNRFVFDVVLTKVNTNSTNPVVLCDIATTITPSFCPFNAIGFFLPICKMNRLALVWQQNSHLLINIIISRSQNISWH